jgi:uncharacterized protein
MFKKIITASVCMLLSTASVLPVFAQSKYSIKQMTPEVKQALDSRRDRFDQLRVLKASGAIGENNKGYVEVLRAEGNAKSLASAENTDRRTIYQTIAEQNGLEGAISTIESVFAQVQRDKADPGDQIQTPDGAWASK